MTDTLVSSHTTNPGARPPGDSSQSARSVPAPSRIPLLGGVLAAIGASACCVGPLLLLSLGIGGAWIGNLTALTPYRPVFVTVTLLFLALAFRRLYLRPQVCTPGTACADPRTLRNQRAIFWVVTALLVALLTFPWYGPWLLA